MKFIDILSDKIDFLFRRSKTADERAYDFFIRTVTFLILALIILCYGSFVHADDSFPISVGVDLSKISNTWLFNNTDSVNFCDEYYGNDVNPQYIPNYSHEWVKDLPFDSSYDISSNYIIVYDCNSSNNSWVVVCTVPKNLISDGHVIFYCGDQCKWVSDGNYSMNYYVVNQSYTIYETGTYNITSGLGSWNMGSDYYGKKTVFANMPLYCGDFSVNGFNYLVSNDFQDDVNNLYNMNYYCFPDLDLCEGAYISNGIGEIITDQVESARNHLYLEDFQIGLSATTNLADLMSSDVIIGISGDDYIQNHPDEFEVWIDYHVMLKDSITGVSDPDVHYSYYYPARTFLNGVYSMGINEIFEHMTLSNNSSLYNYYRNLKDTYNQKVVADGQTFVRGLFPDLYKTLWEHYIGGYYVDNAVTTNNTIFNFDFEVSVAIRESGSNNISGIGTKKFDFLNGTESITTASVLQNHDPWEGESDPQMSPAVPSTGSSISSGSGGGGSVNVKVDVSGQKIPLGVKTKAQMEEILKNYRDVYGEFDSNWFALADENNDNNFLKVLGLTLPEIPAIDYMVQCACVVFGLAVVLFGLKVLLF